MPTFLDSLKSWFKPRPVKLTGAKLYAACVSQARLAVFYLDYGIEDAIGARFEMLSLHIILLVTALKSVPPEDPRHEQALDTSQSLFDDFLLALDSALREQGTGDLTVPKKMKRLGIVIYTRMKSWDDMWREGASLAVQADYAALTLYAGSAYDGGDGEGEGIVDDSIVQAEVGGRARAMARYIMQARDALDIDGLLEGRVTWAQPAPVDESTQLDTALDTGMDSAESVVQTA